MMSTTCRKTFIHKRFVRCVNFIHKGSLFFYVFFVCDATLILKIHTHKLTRNHILFVNPNCLSTLIFTTLHCIIAHTSFVNRSDPILF